MKTLLTFGAGAVAPWVAAVVLHRMTQRRQPPPDPTDPTDLRVPSFKRVVDFSDVS